MCTWPISKMGIDPDSTHRPRSLIYSSKLLKKKKHLQTTAINLQMQTHDFLPISAVHLLVDGEVGQRLEVVISPSSSPSFIYFGNTFFVILR